MTITLSHVEFKCPAHTALSDSDLYDVIKGSVAGENIRKNKAIDKLLTDTNLNLSSLQADGSYQFKNGVAASWAWSGTGADRVLTVTVTGANLSTSNKSAVNTWCTSTFGAGKVILA